MDADFRARCATDGVTAAIANVPVAHRQRFLRRLKCIEADAQLRSALELLASRLAGTAT
jgi:hypothetical protein